MHIPELSPLGVTVQHPHIATSSHGFIQMGRLMEFGITALDVDETIQPARLLIHVTAFRNDGVCSQYSAEIDCAG